MRRSQTSFSLLLLLRQSEKFQPLGGCGGGKVEKTWVGKFSIAILWFISFAPKLLYFDSRQTNVRIEIKRKAATGSSSSSLWKTCEKHARRLKDVDEGFPREKQRWDEAAQCGRSTQFQSETPDPAHESESDSGLHHHPHALLPRLTSLCILNPNPSSNPNPTRRLLFSFFLFFFLYISHSVKFSKCHFAVISWIIRLQLR